MRQQDGTAAPDWVQVDVATGELIIEAPQDSGTLQLTLVAIDGGQQRSIDLEVNLDEMREEDEAQLEDAPANSDEIEAEEPTAPEEQELGQFLPLMHKLMPLWQIIITDKTCKQPCGHAYNSVMNKKTVYLISFTLGIMCATTAYAETFSARGLVTVESCVG